MSRVLKLDDWLGCKYLMTILSCLACNIFRSRFVIYLIHVVLA